ncbi:hypothetical protein HK405_009523, partial [Cladochytrium tenue]
MPSPIGWPLCEQVDLPNVLLDPHPVFFTSTVDLQHAANTGARARPGPSPARSSSGGGMATTTDASPPPSPASSTSVASISAATTSAMAAASGFRVDVRVAAFFASNAAAPRLFSSSPQTSSVSLRWTISLKPSIHVKGPRGALPAESSALPLIGLVELRYPRQPPLDQGPPSAPPLLPSVTYDAVLSESGLSRSADNYSGLWRHGLNRRSSQLSVTQFMGVTAAASPLPPPELVICIDEEHYGGQGYAIEAARGLLLNQFKQEAAPPSLHTL